MLKPLLKPALIALSLAALPAAHAAVENYKVDPRHSYVVFEISHLGFSTMQGRFNELGGKFSYDKDNPSASKIEMLVKTDSVDTNDAERNGHLRGEKYLNTEQNPEARFVSTKFTDNGNGKAALEGNLTLNGVTRPITVAVDFIGAGDDPWGDYRRGYVGTTKIDRTQFGMASNLPKADEVMLKFVIEGIREK